MASRSSGLYGDHLGHTFASQPKKGVCKCPGDVWRPAGLTQLQEEVLVVCPQRGGDGKLAGDD